MLDIDPDTLRDAFRAVGFYLPIDDVERVIHAYYQALPQPTSPVVCEGCDPREDCPPAGCPDRNGTTAIALLQCAPPCPQPCRSCPGSVEPPQPVKMPASPHKRRADVEARLTALEADPLALAELSLRVDALSHAIDELASRFPVGRLPKPEPAPAAHARRTDDLAF